MQLERKRSAFVEGALLGAVCYVLIYGVRLLDVSYIDWLMSNQDLMQHYFGWAYYRYDAWHFPLGLAQNFGYPFGVPITYTDSIPLMAIFFKLLNPWLSSNFQYLGLWGFLCFILQGAFAALLVQKYTKHFLLIGMGALLFIFSPVMLARMYGHTALASQWLLLWAIVLWEKRQDFVLHHEECWLWPLLAGVSVLIHPYFTAMIFVSLFFYTVDRYRHGIAKRLLIGMLGSSLFIALFLFWLLGGFSVGLDKSTDMLGFYSMNLNAFFNPLGWSALLKDLPLATPGQGEGFQYLGAGGIFLLLVAGYKRLTTPISVKSFNISLAAWIFACFLLAVGNYFTFNQQVLLQFSLPLWLEKLWGTFSSSGRLFWPVTYLLLLWMIRQVVQKTTVWRQVAVFLLVALGLQMIDLYPPLLARHNFYIRHQIYQSRFTGAFWEDMAQSKHHVMLLPADRFKYGEVSWYVTQHHLSLNTGNFARWSYGKINTLANQEIEKIKQQQGNPDTLYLIANTTTVFRDFSQQPVYLVNGYFVADNSLIAGKYDRREVRPLHFSETTIEAYLATVMQRQDRLLLLAASDEASENVSREAILLLQQLGLKAELQHKNRWSYGAALVVGQPTPLYERLEQALIQETLAKGTSLGKYQLAQTIVLESAGNPYGNHAKLSIDGIDYSPNERGLNIILYNLAEQNVEEIAHFDTYAGNRGKVISFQE